MNLDIETLINCIDNGSFAIPDFQRSYVWEPEEIKQLFCSILDNYHIGYLLLLETERDNCPFKYTPVSGACVEKFPVAFNLILDGQQRITSLYYAIKKPNIAAPNRKNRVRFFININAVCSGEEIIWENAIVYALENNSRKITEYEKQSEYIEICDFYNVSSFGSKLYPIIGDKLFKLTSLSENLRKRRIENHVLDRSTDFHRVVETFERLNKNGTPLSQYELIAAHLYKKNIKLNEILKELENSYSKKTWWPKSTREKNLLAVDILKVISLSKEGEIDRNSLIKINVDSFSKEWSEAVFALDLAYTRVKEKYGAFKEKYIPVDPMIIPLASLLKRFRKSSDSTFAKIDKWYWKSCYSGRYREAANTRSESDVKLLTKWIQSDKDEDCPTFLSQFTIDSLDFDNIKENSHLYRAIVCTYVVAGCFDFQTGQRPALDEYIAQDDHIFPESKFKDDNILNRTIITTNQKKNNIDPSEYFSELSTMHGRSELISILGTHLISEHGLNALLLNDIASFKKDRKTQLIEKMKEMV